MSSVVEKIFRKFKEKYERGIHALKISTIKSGLIYIKSVFEEFKKPYWLAAGTYLG